MRGRDLAATLPGPMLLAGALIFAITACGSDGPDAAPPVGAGDQSIEPGDADRGQQLFDGMGCASCHGASGQGGVAPRLVGLIGTTVELADGSIVTVDEAYVRRSILAPQDDLVAGYATRMPKLVFDDGNAADLVAFIRRLPVGAK